MERKPDKTQELKNQTKAHDPYKNKKINNAKKLGKKNRVEPKSKFFLNDPCWDQHLPDE